MLILNVAPCFNVVISLHTFGSPLLLKEIFAQLFNIILIIIFILNAIKLLFHFHALDIQILQSS